jgi:hypothetical protein
MHKKHFVSYRERIADQQRRLAAVLADDPTASMILKQHGTSAVLGLFAHRAGVRHLRAQADAAAALSAAGADALAGLASRRRTR